ncbi:hypothetical protein AKJ63_01890 [candidate division MSBL1 archaeon SCGC-AAA259D18]|uniref:Uncharacterized protein n=1 Tax=candidate division MSBL1 archaeon SCGC-AAA259D18 TaxID=1698262 RepID=A0A133UAB1_9EURY|nr:hypothetical protein AKJ63_01890 [candidate division MSBL1 archaeon SCGC-AAA259D18]
MKKKQIFYSGPDLGRLLVPTNTSPTNVKKHEKKDRYPRVGFSPFEDNSSHMLLGQPKWAWKR